MTDTTDLGGTLDLDELWALRAEQAARRDDADARIARLDEEVRVLYAQQADERADAACWA